jgi:rhamnosyltransferase
VKFSGMVTLYNPSKKNIDIIKNYIDGLDKIYLIDNSNKDNSDLIPNDKRIIYVPNKDNLGIAKALNMAANKAINDGYKWILTMDQDSELTLEVLEKLEQYVENHDMDNVGIVSPYHDVESNTPKKNKEAEEMVEVMTSGNLLNLDLYQKVGGFKDWLFIDLVDIEYCFNLRKSGYKVLRLNNVVMKHQLGDTTVHKFLIKKFICSNHSAIRRYYMVRNVFYVTDMYKKYFPGYCRYLKKVQRGQVRYIILFEKDKINKLKMMYKGLKDYKNNIKGRIEL